MRRARCLRTLCWTPMRQRRQGCMPAGWSSVRSPSIKATHGSPPAQVKRKWNDDVVFKNQVRCMTRSGQWGRGAGESEGRLCSSK